MLLVEHRGTQEIHAAGTLCPDPSAGLDTPCEPGSLFDLASVTKLATTALCLALVRERVVALDMPFREVVPDFRGKGKERVTLAQVLTHTAGLAWWRPLYREARTIEEAVWLAAQEPLAHDPGTVVYSDLGYVMLTAGLAGAGDAPFGELVRERVLRPVGAETAAFGPRPPERCAATRSDPAWRRKRMRGEVDDENAYAMGGVAGHAGLFGTAADLAAIARVFRDGAVIGNDLASLARREHARGTNARRGLGVALRAPEDPMTGRWMSAETWGHTGFTGTSLWVDPAIDLTVVLLTNRVFHAPASLAADPGERQRELALDQSAAELYRFRIAVHEALSEPLAAGADGPQERASA